MPFVVTFVSMPLMEAEARQYGLFQAIVMEFYNLPALAISGLSFFLGRKFITNGAIKKARAFFLVSAIVSIAGSGLMIAWGFATLG